MRYLLKNVISIEICLFVGLCQAQTLNYQNSPLNYENSALNYQNSPLNYQNSPLNYQNSPLNFNSNNGIFDNSGKRLGYEVQSPSGVTNYFDNSGNRIGYSPAQGRR